MKLKTLIFLIIGTVILSSCSNENQTELNKQLEKRMNKISKSYVKLILQIGRYDADYVDAYYGPESWKPKDTSKVNFDSTAFNILNDKADDLLNQMDELGKLKGSNIEVLRFTFLYKQMLAAKTIIFMLHGVRLSFDEESKALYDAVAPHYSNQHFQKIIDQLDKIIPGTGDVTQRLKEFKKNFIIPKEKLDTVFKSAIAECRKRTIEHIELPPNENFKVEYVTDKPWGGYNWYKGNSFSVIQVNTDLPIYIDRAVDLAAHEGYPGHHVYNTLLEKHLVKELGWMEFTVYPLFSPQSLIAEGTANFGIHVVFPGNSRVEFEKQVLFPLAGLDSSKADLYYKVLGLTNDLDYAVNEAARNYIDGKANNDQTVSYLMKYALLSKDRAKHMLSFIEKYGSYVINYNLGQEIVKDYIIRHGGTDDNPELRWKYFAYLLSMPMTPSGLRETKK
jgi:hypothetical protein